MIKQAVDRAFEVVNANFNTDYAALLTAAGVAVIAADIYDRVSAERFYAHVAVGVGVYHLGNGNTSRRRPGSGTGAGIRDTETEVVLDFYVRGTVEATVRAQAEIAVAALLQSVDEFAPDDTRNVWGVGDERGSVTWETEYPQLVEDRSQVEVRTLLRVPVMTREDGL